MGPITAALSTCVETLPRPISMWSHNKTASKHRIRKRRSWVDVLAARPAMTMLKGLAYNGPDEESVLPSGETAEEPGQPIAPRPAHGHSKDGRPDLKQVLLSLGVSGDGSLPLRLGLRDGNTSDSTETPVALEECLALGLEGIIGIVADSKAYSQ